MDAFLSHNSQDKPAVEALAQRLQAEGISCWLDKWNLIPGEPWQEAIEEALRTCKSCVVFIGPGEFGPWQNEEMRRAIRRRVEESSDSRLRVIPCVLPGGIRGERSQLPDFLVSTTWVEFRQSLDEEEAFHRLKCGILGIAPGPTVGVSLPEGESPYRGLEAFQAEHAPFYFGRDADVEWLINELRTGSPTGSEIRFLGILGASGSGKSSLARAGLVPAIRKGRQIPGSQTWPIVILRPGANPLESLAIRLAQDEVLKAGVGDIAEFKAKMLEDETRLHLAVAQAIDREGDETRRALLIVDQFEEVFTVCDDEKERAAFLANLLYAATVATGRTIVVPAMRADFLPQCAAYTKLAHALSDHQHLVGAMGREALRQVIEGPAQLVGCEFDQGLVEMLLDDMENQPPGALPLLEHCLHQLWERRGGRKLTVKAYNDIGRIDGALERHADSIFEDLSSEEQKACARLFTQLVRPGEGSEDTKRQAVLERAAPDEVTRQLVQRLADKDARLLSADATGDAVRVEITHEALIRNWGRLRRWIEENREAILVQQRLEQDAAEWNANGRKAKYLYTGARLEEGKQWMRDHRKLRREFPVEFAFVQAAQARANRRGQVPFSLTTLALFFSALAMVGMTRALDSRDQVRRESGLQAIDKASNQPLRYPDQLFHRARAIGFAGYGGAVHQQRNWATQGREFYDLIRGRTEQFPMLLPDRIDTLQGELAGLPAYLPIWRSAAHGDAVEGLTFEGGGQLLLARYPDGKVRQWNLEVPDAEPQIIEGDVPESLESTAVVLDGYTVMFHAYGQEVELTGHPAKATAWTLSGDNQRLAVGLEDGAVIIWDVSGGRLGEEADLLVFQERGWFEFDEQQNVIGGFLSDADHLGDTLVAAQSDQEFKPENKEPWQNSLGMDLLYVKPGEFFMGSPKSEEDRNTDEVQHKVILTQGFWMAKYEVTQAGYEAVMGSNPSVRKDPLAPVEWVSWIDAMGFCEKLTELERRANLIPEGWEYTLPTEAQWEYACRAGTTTPFSFGRVLDGARANCDGQYPYGTSVNGPFLGQTAAVGRYGENPWGLYDMHGNVNEWCLDWYGEYPGDAVTDPTGPKKAASRIIRGGSWSNDAWYCRSALRRGGLPDYRDLDLGFRPVLVPAR